METLEIRPPLRMRTGYVSNKDIVGDFYLAYLSRLVSKQIRTDVLTGRAKFGIESAGKELCQIAMSRAFRLGDYFSGYYRDQTFMMHKGLASVKEIFATLYADAANDPFGAGRNMNGNFATPFLDEHDNWKELTDEYNVASALAPLGGQIPRGLGLALASKYYGQIERSSHFSNNGAEVSFVVLGDATTSEGIFLESLNAACVMQVPVIFVVQDNGYGISVSTELQTAKGSISKALAGFQRTKEDPNGCEIYKVKGWDYHALLRTFKKAVDLCRDEHVPILVHVDELTQLNGHSTSGSHERYKPEERLQWELEMDCLVHFENLILEQGILSSSELESLKEDAKTALKDQRKEAWSDSQRPFVQLKKELGQLLDKLESSYSNLESIMTAKSNLKSYSSGVTATILAIADDLILDLIRYGASEALTELKQWQLRHNDHLQDVYKSHLYCDNDHSALTVPVVPAQYDEDAPVVNGYEILNAYFDQLLDSDERVSAFGEDVGLIGGVNQAFAGLQAKYGDHRVFDTGIREWSIVGQGMGMAMRGLKPIAEVQYLDYLIYALPVLADDLATLRWRTAGQQSAPVIIRTRGHRLEGIWHSGSPMSMLLGSMKGVYLLTPRNMTQAAGMYNTLMKGNDPAVLVECLNGYRKKERLPHNLDTFTVPLGLPEVMISGVDITLVTYGVCVGIAEEAARHLQNVNISIELIDVQTLMPFDLEHVISASLKKTNRIIFLDEDVPGGGTAYMMQEVLEKQKAYKYLDAPPICISATEHRPPYGDDGNYASKPLALDIVKAAMEIMNESEPQSYGNYV